MSASQHRNKPQYKELVAMFQELLLDLPGYSHTESDETWGIVQFKSDEQEDKRIFEFTFMCDPGLGMKLMTLAPDEDGKLNPEKAEEKMKIDLYNPESIQQVKNWLTSERDQQVGVNG